MNKPIYFIILWILIVSGCLYFWWWVLDMTEMYEVYKNSKALLEKIRAQ